MLDTLQSSLSLIDRVQESTKAEDALRKDAFEHSVQTRNVSTPYSAMQYPMTKGPHAWKKRPRSPGLKWYKDYDSPDSLKNGRILIIDYVKRGKMLSCAGIVDPKAELPHEFPLMVCRLLQRRHAQSCCARDQFS